MEEAERLEMMGDLEDDADFADAAEADAADPDTLPYKNLTTEQRLKRDLEDEASAMSLSKDEAAGERLMAMLADPNFMERRKYERVVQIVRGMHDQMLVLQRYPDDDENSTEILNDVMWTGSLYHTEKLVFAFSKNCHQWDSGLHTDMWSSHMPMPMPVAADFYTATEIKRTLLAAGVDEHVRVTHYTACGLVQKPLSQQKSSAGTRERAVMVVLDKAGGGGGGDSGAAEGEIVVPGAEIDCLYLHEQFYEWGRFGAQYFREPASLKHWSMTQIARLLPMPAPMEAKLSAGYLDVDWFAAAMPVNGKFFMLTDKCAVRLDFPDETSREYVQRLIGRYLLAKDAAKT